MTLLEAIQQEANPEIKAQIARGMGIEEGMVAEGIRLAAPLPLTASGDLAATTTGVERLFAMVRAYGDLARETVDAATGADDDALVEELFGAGRAKVAATMHDATGFDLTAFLPIVAPL